jgi:hypothetical protein
LIECYVTKLVCDLWQVVIVFWDPTSIIRTSQ